MIDQLCRGSNADFDLPSGGGRGEGVTPLGEKFVWLLWLLRLLVKKVMDSKLSVLGLHMLLELLRNTVCKHGKERAFVAK